MNGGEDVLRGRLRGRMPVPAMESFLRLYRRYKACAPDALRWEDVGGLDVRGLTRYEDLPLPGEELSRRLLNELVVCKLNGGLGTTMGCSGPKSAIIVRDGRSFLDLIVEQLCELNTQYGANVSLYLMNSFYTHAQTAAGKYAAGLAVAAFEQSKFPRLRKGVELPLEESEFGAQAWCPPGHGDFYDCILQAGVLDEWLRSGKRFVFISNADNLGAVADPSILRFMAEARCPFLMEVTPKTLADVKGGTLYRHDGRLRLLEVAQVPEARLDEFYGAEKFPVFNTNNIWIDLHFLRDRLAAGPVDLPVIVNPKSVEGTEVIQLETAVGAAIECFPGGQGMIVPRARYLPVKRTADLLLLQSDLFLLERGCLRRNPARQRAGLPLIRFGEALADVDNYRACFPHVPSLLDLEALDLDGRFVFGEGVVLRGRVVMRNGGAMARIVPERAVLRDQNVEV